MQITKSLLAHFQAFGCQYTV